MDVPGCLEIFATQLPLTQCYNMMTLGVLYFLLPTTFLETTIHHICPANPGKKLLLFTLQSALMQAWVFFFLSFFFAPLISCFIDPVIIYLALKFNPTTISAVPPRTLPPTPF